MSKNSPAPMLRAVARRARLLYVFVCLVSAVVAGRPSPSIAEDWPTYNHDAARSAVSRESLPLPLTEAWRYRAPHPPIPAWDEPATWDGWNKVYGMKNRQVYDKALHTVAAGDHVYFGSSVDDKVYCLDKNTGEPYWSVFSEAPVRLAPTVAGGKVYFGSDDGYVYCVDKLSGQTIWKHRPGPSDRRVPGNGRIVSIWAIRTSVVVLDGKAYCCAGVVPSETVYLCAMDAETGKELWKSSMNDFPAQGYMLASPTRLYVTTGRNQPLVFERATGKRLFQADGGTGGTYALLTGDTLFYGPNKTGEVTAVGAAPEDHLATFTGNHMIVTGDMSYLHTDTELSALDRTQYIELFGQRKRILQEQNAKSKALRDVKGEEAERLAAEIKRLKDEADALTAEMAACVRWKVACDCPLSLMLAGATIFAGGPNTVAAYDAANGDEVWRSPVDGAAYGLSVANGQLYVSTDRGLIHCFKPVNRVAARPGNPLLDEPAVAQDRSFQQGSTWSFPLSLRERAGVRAPEQDHGPSQHALLDELAVARNLPRFHLGSPLHDRAAVAPQGGLALALAGALFADEPAAPKEDRVTGAPLPIHGPICEFIDAGTLEVRWTTDRPMTSIVEIGRADQAAAQHADARLKTEHAIQIPDVGPDPSYSIRVAGEDVEGNRSETPKYAFDGTLNYAPGQAPRGRSPYADDALAARYDAHARQLLDRLGTRKGYALVLGSREGRLAFHLAQHSDLQIVIVEPDPRRAQQVRELLDAAGIYGVRASVHIGPYDSLPYGSYLFNLVTSDPALAGETLPRLSDLYRLVHPAGGVAVFGRWAEEGKTTPTRDELDKWAAEADLVQGATETIEIDGAPFFVHRRDKLPGAGEWTHQYGRADNSACSQDNLIQGSLSVLWWGRPGSRPMPDRGPRNPAPVSANGRLFVQGNRTLFGLDSYNGAILWFKQIPTMRRANMPRDASNMVATDDYLYLTLGNECIGIEGESGREALRFSVPENSAERPYDWGYVAVDGDTLYGGGAKRGSSYLGDEGQWYENFDPAHISRVTSDYLFAIDRHTGEPRWRYDGGVVIHSTIAIYDGRVYFVESRSDAARSAATGRLFDEIQQDQHFVALDAATGEIVWQRPCDLSMCGWTTYLGAGDGVLVVAGADKDKQYHTLAFDAQTGADLWRHVAPVKKEHHTGELSHPAIVRDRIYTNKHTFDLHSGQVLDVTDFDWHGCGTTSCSLHTMFSRYEFHGMQDLATGERTEFLGIRSGCWLSLIPSGGVLLAPETSAGCSCAHPIQTSIAYVPDAAAPVQNIATQSGGD